MALRISDKDGKAMGTASVAVKTATLDPKVDYPMNATDEDWTCMGEGRLGCGAMTTGKLKLKLNGPKMEAIGVMGPFDTVLQLTGKVPERQERLPVGRGALQSGRLRSPLGIRTEPAGKRKPYVRVNSHLQRPFISRQSP